MPRPLFVLLLVVPQLLPPGFCLCRLGSATVQAETAKVATSSEEPACKCRNPNCRHRQTTTPAKPERPPNPEPAPDHAPSCPAHPGQAVLRAAAVEVPVLFADLCLVAAAVPTSDAPLLEPSPLPAAVPPPRSAPLFLLDCDFRC